jgi:hypothetical protein
MSLPEPQPHDLLLAHRGVASLPVPAPLDLVEIPFIRATYKLEERDEAGNLPIEAYKIVHETTGGDGGLYRVVIQGSAEHGLPYGNDGDILVALFKLLDQHQLVDGLFPHPSVRMIADALGLPMTGQNAERIRGALARLAHVRFETRRVYHAEDLACAIRSGEDVTPAAPDSGLPRRRPAKGAQQEEVTWLIQYRWETSYDRMEDGEQRITHLWVNPVWVAQAIAGWAAWIDTDAYAALSGPIARRMYQLMASFAARGRPSPWSFTLEELRAACAMSATAEPKKLRDRLMKAGEGLREAGVLRRFEVASPKKGRYTFVAEPGPVLEVAGALRGVGLLDPRETRSQLLLLSHYGVNARVARQLVRDQAHQVYWVLCYVMYRENVGERIDNPGGFIRRLVQEGYNPRGEEGFQRWYERRMEALAAPPASETPSHRRLAAATAAPPIAPAAEPEPLPDDVWGRVRGRLRAEITPQAFDTWLRPTWMEIHEASELRVATPNPFAVEWIHDKYGARIAELLTDELTHPVRFVVRHNASPSDAA